MSLRQLGSCAIATLFLTGVATAALAQDSNNQSSGSTKATSSDNGMQTNRSSNKNNDMNTGSSPAVGGPGIEGPAGSKSGPAPKGSRQ